MKKNQNKQVDRMRELAVQIAQADEAYYKYDNPKMTDRDYDLLVDELKELEKDTGIVLSSSPTQRVPGAVLEGLKPVRHTKPMLSADKTKSVEDLLRFAQGKDVILSWKLDGLTLVLRYDKGSLIQAITRGKDGIIGEDVTHTVRKFLNVPLSVPVKDKFEVRGEGVISWSNFNEINSSMAETYSHPRGLAAGSVRKLDASDVMARRLEFWAFELISDKTGRDNKREELQFLSSNGFDVVPYAYIEADSSAERIMCNRYLLMLGIRHMLLTEKSYARQGSNQIPTIHLGAKACAMEKKGIPTLRGKMNMKIRMQNRTKMNEKIDHLKDKDKNIERMRG